MGEWGGMRHGHLTLQNNHLCKEMQGRRCGDMPEWTGCFGKCLEVANQSKRGCLDVVGLLMSLSGGWHCARRRKHMPIALA